MKINERNLILNSACQIAVLFAIIILIPSCKSDSPQPEEQSGKISFTFNHRIDGEAIVFDDMQYINAAGNHYLVNEIQYFISDVTLHMDDGSQHLLDAWEDIHYVDTDIEDTKKYYIKDEITPGNYTGVSFTFGISEQKNQSLMFVNPPESLMFWPELLGGGYHYMKLNGKWLDTLDQVSPFNFHLGIGQVYHAFPDSITEYIHNDFEVNIDGPSFLVESGKTTELTLVMQVENWFKNPNVFNHNQWGGDIMQKHEAMRLACENGADVFMIEK